MTALIKNCGLKTPESIKQAAETGASFVGFVHFPKSPRHLSLEEGAQLQALVPTNIKRVAVLVAPDDALLTSIATQWKPDYLQLHDVQDIDRILYISTHFKLPIILGWPVASAEDIRMSDIYQGLVDYLLLDTKKSGEHGGTGEAFDWKILTQERPLIPWFLAGGLTPENVAEALHITHSPMVDVSSGLESTPGVKSLEKIAAFNRAVLHGADD